MGEIDHFVELGQSPHQGHLRASSKRTRTRARAQAHSRPYAHRFKEGAEENLRTRENFNLFKQN